MHAITTLLRFAIILLALVATDAVAQTLPQNTTSGLPRTTDTASATVTQQSTATEINVPTHPFSFGVEAGANIDFSSTESTCFDIDIYGGYRRGVIQVLGLGVGFHPTFAHNRRFIPIYALLRCNFKPGRSLCFADVKVGMSINELDNMNHNTGVYASAGIGFNLWQTRRLKTYALLGYNFTQIVPFKQYTDKALHGVSIRIGVMF